MGVRPQYLALDPDDPMFSAEVEVIESHGSDDAIYLAVDGRELTAVVDQGEVQAGTASVGVNIDAQKVWLFDGNGKRII